MKRMILVLSALSIPTLAYAQVPVPNPTTVTFDHVDFISASRYEGGYFQLPVLASNTCDVAATPGAQPTVLDNLGRPTTTTGVGISALLVAKPIGCYVYKVRAYDTSGLISVWSDPSNPLVKLPAPPNHVVNK